ncbi:hypothetical protein M758_9G051300 [Ceratodon purpureus]|nr:hypothetical protein M758_9G051300 [Ceratodon purpureus]
MRGWPGCASRQMGMRAGFHPVPARVLAMATASGTGFGATLSRECASSGGGNRHRWTSLPVQRVLAIRSAGRGNGFSVSRILRIASVREAGFSNVVRCEAASAGTENQTESSYNSRESVHWAVFKEGALQRLAGVLVGSALLIASLGLGLTKPALARAPLAAPSTASSTLQNEEATEVDSDTEDGEQGELERTPSQPAKEEEEEERDPAELVLLSYLNRHPKDEKTLEGLLYVRLRKGSVAKALETVDNLLELRPDHAPWQLIRAQSLEFLGDLEAARDAFEGILEKDPLSARALQGLATVMAKAGEGTEMLEMLRRAVQSAMDVGKTKEAKNLRMLLGQMYTLQGNLQEALAEYQELEKEDPRDFRPYLCQGLVYSLLNQKNDAEKAFLKYRRRCPKTFPERGYLDDLMIGAKTEARKQQTEERLKPANQKGKKKPKPLQQPNVQAAFSENPDGEEPQQEEEE